MNGVLERTPAGPRLRFVRTLAHPREKVWRALTDPEHLAAWFPDAVEVERWEAGATLHFGAADGFDGEILTVEEPRLLEFRWGTDVLRFELEPAPGGQTTLTLLDTLDELGKAARDGAGWHACLDRLVHHLDDREPAWTIGERWRAVHPSYVAAMGPEGATIGPPEGAPG